jgi:hypothetical protein
MAGIPQAVPCGNSACERNLPIEGYHRLFPDPTTPADMIHKNYHPSWPYFSVHCPTCGHFTIWYPTNYADVK